VTVLTGARVLVTGGAGFIGSHLVEAVLREPGVRAVLVLDNLRNGSLENLVAVADDPRLEVLVDDVTDPAAVERAVAGADVVMHLACLGVRHSLHSPLENHRVNAEGTLLLLEAARASGVRRFVHVSSSEVYGTAQYAPMDELHPTWPETVYGGSKLAGEAYARAAFRTHGLPVVVARPFNTYGPRSHFAGDSGEVIPRTIVRALCGLPALIFGDGEQTRDFMHVTDTAAGLLALARCDAGVGRTVNLGAGTEVSINELVRTVSAAVGRPDLVAHHDEPRPGDVRRLLVDNTVMTALTGFRPRVGFAEGIADLVTWFRAAGHRPEDMLALIEDRNWVPGHVDGATAVPSGV